MATESQDPQSLSNFLRSYSPDAFEWENSGYNPRSNFIWSGSLMSVPSGSFLRSPTKEDALFCEGRSSPGTETLSDMSISLSDISSGHYFAILPPMLRSRAISVSAIHSAVPSSDSRSSTNMSISSAASDFPNVLEDFESFERNVSASTYNNPLASFAFPDVRSSAVRTGACMIYGSCDDDLDAAAVERILEWTTSLFAAVASTALTYSIQSGIDDSCPTSTHSLSQSSEVIIEDEESCFLSCTKDSDVDVWASTSHLVVKLNPVRQSGVCRPILPDPLSILMPGVIDYESINPEQSTTAKAVCMWGRRLERIPKVRLAGQKEAVYCFDARKQRQKQKASNVLPSQPSANRYVANEPTQIFYRARPLYSPFVRRDLPTTPVDAVKITKGQVLLQNVNPVHFCPASPWSYVGAQQPSQRLPFSPRTNDSNQNWRSGYTSTPMHVKKIPGRGFL